jgi:hypothetical protein
MKSAARIFTLADFIEALSSSKAADTTAGHSWKEKLEIPCGDPLSQHYIQSSRTLNPIMFVLQCNAAASLENRLRLTSLRRRKVAPHFAIHPLCPNHDSYLDGPLLISTLPRRIIYNIFILGYSDYWKNAFSRWLAEICNILQLIQTRTSFEPCKLLLPD